jgi:hypothetical protein
VDLATPDDEVDTLDDLGAVFERDVQILQFEYSQDTLLGDGTPPS